MDRSVDISRTVVGSSTRVYATLTDIDLFTHWAVPNPDMPTDILVDATEGGSWRIHVPTEFTLEGTYLELSPVDGVASTWVARSLNPRWDALATEHDTKVQIQLDEVEAGTTITLHHTGLSDADNVDAVADFWDRTLGRLVGVL